MGPTGTRRWFSRDHVWIDSDGYVGVTEELFRGLHEIVSVELPAEGTPIRAAETMATVEGDKGLIDVYAPGDGVVLQRNDALRLSELRAVPRRTWLLRVDARHSRLLSEDEYEGAKAALPRIYPRE